MERDNTHHVGGVAAGSKDDGHLSIGVEVVGSNQSTGRVVDEGRELDRDVVLEEGLAEELGAVDTLDSRVAETLGPSDEDTMVDLVLAEGGRGDRRAREQKMVMSIDVLRLR